jgi:GDP-L-fucose synthase
MKVLVTGGRGFLGQHVCAALEAAGMEVLAPSRDILDVTHTRPLAHWLHLEQPDAVVHLAKPPSDGISTLERTPATYMAGLLTIDRAVIMTCAHATPQPKLVCLGSVCSYPEEVTYPVTEDQLWNGYPEAVNAPYGIAKRAQLTLLQAARREFGLNGIQLIVSNLYGPGDRSGHVIPSLIARVRRALVVGGPVTVWGEPEVTRSFLYAPDAAEGIVEALRRYAAPAPINLCAAEEVTMLSLIGGIAHRLYYHGSVEFDSTRPTGHRRRAFSLTAMRRALDWQPTTTFSAGLAATIDWSLAHVPADENAQSR